MTRRAWLYGVWLTLLTVIPSSCVPATVTKVSSVVGVLTASGEPLGGVEVVYTWDPRSEKPRIARDTTDVHGRFSFEGDKGIGLIILLPAHSMTEIELKFSGRGDELTLAGWSYQLGGHVERFEFTCDRDRIPPETCAVIEPPRLDAKLFWTLE